MITVAACDDMPCVLVSNYPQFSELNMARAATPPPPKESARLTAEQMNTGITRLEGRISELEQFDVNKRGSEEADSGSA
jgi:hypothetical protein